MGVHDRCRPRPGPTLSGLLHEVLGRAPPQGDLPWLRRRARPGRRAPTRDQRRLRYSPRSPGGDEQGRGRGRGAHPRRKLASHCARLPHEGVAAGDRAHHPPDHLSLLCGTRRVPHPARVGLGATAEALSGADQRSLRQARPQPASATARDSRRSRYATSTPCCTAH